VVDFQRCVNPAARDASHKEQLIVTWKDEMRMAELV